MAEEYKGNCAYRLVPERDNPREVAFADEWVEQNRVLNNPRCSTGTLGYLIAKEHGTWELPSDRDEMVAATVVQWLGSNVGFSFVQNALERCGYRVVKADKEDAKR